MSSRVVAESAPATGRSLTSRMVMSKVAVAVASNSSTTVTVTL